MKRFLLGAVLALMVASSAFARETPMFWPLVPDVSPYTPEQNAQVPNTVFSQRTALFFESRDRDYAGWPWMRGGGRDGTYSYGSYKPPGYVGCWPDVAYGATDSVNVVRYWNARPDGHQYLQVNYPPTVFEPLAFLLPQFIWNRQESKTMPGVWTEGWGYESYDDHTGMVIESCIAKAASLGYRYAVLTSNYMYDRRNTSGQDLYKNLDLEGNACFGTNAPVPTNEAYRGNDWQHCYSKCTGNAYESCGGAMSGSISMPNNGATWVWMSVYDTQPAPPPPSCNLSECQATCTSEGYPNAWCEGGNCMCDW